MSFQDDYVSGVYKYCYAGEHKSEELKAVPENPVLFAILNGWFCW